MDINSIKSNLEMNNFYFSNYSFTREKCISNGKYNINVEKYIKKIDIHEYHVILQTSIKKSNNINDFTTWNDSNSFTYN